MTLPAIRRRAVPIVGVLAVILTALMFLTLQAGAATRGCSNVQGGQCGSQELVGASLMLASHVNTSRNLGAELKAAGSAKPTEDFESLQPPKQPLTGGGTFELARKGRPSGLCLTGAGNSAIFAKCNLASFSDPVARRCIRRGSSRHPGVRRQCLANGLAVSPNGPPDAAPGGPSLSLRHQLRGVRRSMPAVEGNRLIGVGAVLGDGEAHAGLSGCHHCCCK